MTKHIPNAHLQTEKEENSMRIVKHVPNALSISRMFLSLSLMPLAYMSGRLSCLIVFTVIYFTIGLTDFLDGFIARKCKVESSLGSKLDAIGDSMMFLCGFASLFLAKVDLGGIKTVLTIGVAMVYKAVNVLLTQARFKQMNMMHTWLSKFVFNALYLCGPVFVYTREINYWLVVGFTVGICLHCVEETITLLKMTEYDEDCKGIWTETLLAKLKRGKEGD